MTDSDNPQVARGSTTIGRANPDNESWQRSDLNSGGRYAGCEYYDRHPPAPNSERQQPLAPVGVGRAIQLTGLAVAVAGLAGWLWLILAFVSSMGRGTVVDDPFGTQWAGIPLGSGGLVAILVGGLVAVVGAGLTRVTDSRRHRSTSNPGSRI